MDSLRHGLFCISQVHEDPKIDFSLAEQCAADDLASDDKLAVVWEL